ncbi:MAG: hypothetical protein JRG91_17485 [Deltaproteobacteria bacterium]|nr:hypothetical protein [Deltaproteobacteria bacterium]
MKPWSTSGLVLLTVMCLAGHASAGEKVKWKKHGYKKGVTVYTKPVEGSKIPRVKGVTKLGATTDEVWEHINDPETRKRGFEVFKELGPCGKDCTYIYQKVSHGRTGDGGRRRTRRTCRGRAPSWPTTFPAHGSSSRSTAARRPA